MNYWPVFFGSSAFVFLSFGLPIYTRELGASALQIGGMYSVFTVTLMLVRPAVGWALDRMGRRRFFVSAFAFYVCAMLLFAHASNMVDFYLARFVQGLGAALMWVSARTIIADQVGSAASTRGEAMGRLTTNSVRGGMVGATYGFTMLAMLPTSTAWRYAFIGYAVAAAVGFLLALKQPETNSPRSHDNVPAGWLRGDLIKLFMVLFCTAFATALIEPIYLIFLQDKFDLPFNQLALAFFPAGIVYAVLPAYGGRLADRFGRGPAIVLGMLIAAVVLTSLPWLTSVVWVAVFYTLTAVGWALAGPAEDALLADLAPAAARGRVFGYREFATGAGASSGPLLGGAMYDYGFAQLPFLATGGMLLVGAGCAWHWFGRQRIIAPAARP